VIEKSGNYDSLVYSVELFFREFQLMVFIPDDSTLLSDPDTNQFLVYIARIES